MSQRSRFDSLREQLSQLEEVAALQNVKEVGIEDTLPLSAVHISRAPANMGKSLNLSVPFFARIRSSWFLTKPLTALISHHGFMFFCEYWDSQHLDYHKPSNPDVLYQGILYCRLGHKQKSFDCGRQMAGWLRRLVGLWLLVGRSVGGLLAPLPMTSNRNPDFPKLFHLDDTPNRK